MPKVKLGYQEQDESFRNTLAHVLVDTPRDKLLKLLGLSSSGFYGHKRYPERVTVRELRILRNTGRITDEQILACIRKEENK